MSLAFSIAWTLLMAGMLALLIFLAMALRAFKEYIAQEERVMKWMKEYDKAIEGYNRKVWDDNARLDGKRMLDDYEDDWWKK